MATLNISLTPEQASLINDKVSSGMYNSAAEVVCEGLRLLQEQDDERTARLKELQMKLRTGAEQIERGDVKVFYSGEELADHVELEGRRILAEHNSPK